MTGAGPCILPVLYEAGKTYTDFLENGFDMYY